MNLIDYYIPKSHQKKIVKILEDVTKKFEEEKIDYFIDGGTLLGSIRCKTIMPWDDDADIGVLDYEFDKVLKLKDYFEGLGYEFRVEPNDAVIKIIMKVDNFLVARPKFKDGKVHLEDRCISVPGLDIFKYTIVNDAFIALKDYTWYASYPNAIYPLQTFYPFQTYKFGKLKLKGANMKAALFYLDSQYPGWREKIIIETRSMFEQTKKKVTFPFTRGAFYLNKKGLGKNYIKVPFKKPDSNDSNESFL